MPRIVPIKLPDDVYEELERRAREEGYVLVSDYVRDLLLRLLRGEALGFKGLEARLERLERGELPPEAVERIAEMVAKRLSSSGAAADVSKLISRVERRLQDMVNPWTAKIDQLNTRLAELVERVERVEERLAELEEARKRVEQMLEQKERRWGRSAIERLHRQGVVFESDVQRLRDRDAFFERLRREGALVFVVGGERVAVDPEFWRNFKEKVEQLPTSNDEEIQVLLTNTQYKLFKKLREEGLVYYDATRKAWKFIERALPEPEEKKAQ